MASTNKEFPAVRDAVQKALNARGLHPSSPVVDVIATVGAGYLEVNDGSAPPLFPKIPAGMVADRMVDLFADGEHPHPPTKAVQRPIFRGAVESTLSAMGVHFGDEIRDTLTSLSLGAWDETQLKSIKVAIAGQIVSLYASGLD